MGCGCPTTPRALACCARPSREPRLPYPPPVPLCSRDPIDRSWLKPPTSILFSMPALKISSATPKQITRLHRTSSGDSPVPLQLGRGWERISRHPARWGGGLQPGPLCASAMVFLLQYVCLPTNELGTNLGSPVPGLGGGTGGASCTIPCRTFGQGLKAVHKQQIQRPLPHSSQPVKATHRNQSVPSAPTPEHPTACRPGASRPLRAHSARRSLAMVHWRKAKLKSQFQPCGCRSGPRRASQPLPRPAEGCFGEKSRG